MKGVFPGANLTHHDNGRSFAMALPIPQRPDSTAVVHGTEAKRTMRREPGPASLGASGDRRTRHPLHQIDRCVVRPGVVMPQPPHRNALGRALRPENRLSWDQGLFLCLQFDQHVVGKGGHGWWRCRAAPVTTFRMSGASGISLQAETWRARKHDAVPASEGLLWHPGRTGAGVVTGEAPPDRERGGRVP